MIHKIRIGNSKGEIDMNIVVLLKQVPDTTAKISVSGGRVDEGAVSKWSMSPYDEYALESALQLKEKMGGDLIAITCGPERCSKMSNSAQKIFNSDRKTLKYTVFCIQSRPKHTHIDNLVRSLREPPPCGPILVSHIDFTL